MKKFERVVFVIMVISFIADPVISFSQGFYSGFTGIESKGSPNVLIHNIWSVSTLLFLLVKGIRYKFK